ncbi:MAG: universal stress protein [Thermoleophilia bacterium]
MNRSSLQTIILGYDGSEGSGRAAELASTIAAAFDSTVIVVVAFPSYPRISSPSKEDAVEIMRAREIGEELTTRLRDRGLRAETDVLEGPAADAILRAAEARGADLIVVGSRGYGQVAGLLLGSVSNRIAHEADRPVLVAR